MRLLKRRIFANNKAAGISIDDKDIISVYFDRTIVGLKPEAYLIYHSWCRPRDIIRFLNYAAEVVPKGGKFSGQSFSAAFSKYSASCWEEKRDELNTKYSQAEIDSIRKIISGFKKIFHFSDFESRSEFVGRSDPRVK